MEDQIGDKSSQIDQILHHLQEIHIRLDSVEHNLYKKDKDGSETNHGTPKTNDNLKVNSLEKSSGHLHSAKTTGHLSDDSEEVIPSDNKKVDLQAEFGAIRDAVGKVKLPADHRLNDQKRGIKRKDQLTLQVLSRSARYVETSFKLLGTMSPDKTLSNEEYDHLYHVQLAHMRFLQDEYAALVVQNNFGPDTAQMFRSIQQNTSGLTQSALHDLKLATSLTSTSATSQTGNGAASRDSNWRGGDRQRGSNYRGRSNYYSSYRGRGGGYASGDAYGYRGVPNQRPQTQQE